MKTKKPFLDLPFKITRKRVLFFLLIVSIIVFGIFWNKNQKMKEEKLAEKNSIYQVKKWDIKNEVKISSQAKLADEQKLSFWMEWKITNVYVKIWDEVKAWQVLAELDMKEYQNNIEWARLDIKNAEITYNKLINNDTSLAEAQKKNQIKETKSSYDLALEQEKTLKNQLDTSIWQKKEQLEQMTRDYKVAEKNLQVEKSSLDVSSKVETEQTEITLKNREQTINSITTSLNSTLWNIEIQIQSVDKIFWVTKTYEEENDEYESFISAKNTSLINDIKTKIYSSYKLIEEYKQKIKEINVQTEDEEINKNIKDLYNELWGLIELFDISLDAIDMSIISEWALTNDDLDWFSSTIKTSRTNLISIREQLNTYSNSINSLLSWESEENLLQLTLEQKQLNYETKEVALLKQKEELLTKAKELKNFIEDSNNQINSKKTEIQNLLEKIDLLNQELKDIQDWADSYDISLYRNSIEQAEVRLQKILDSKKDYQIIAEFKGRIRTVDIVVWEQYKLDDKKYIIVENPNLIELELQVNQIDIVKINEGDKVIITFDSYPNKPIEAKISTRNVNPEPNWKWWYYYKANVLLEKQDIEILAWMSAIVRVITSEAKNILLIPTLSIVYENWKTLVYVKENTLYKIREVKIWIMNNFEAEVIEGLKEWEVIKSSVLDEEQLKKMWIDDTSSKIF